MFYDVYCELCRKNGLTPSGAAAKIGFNRASVTVWKNSGNPPKTELLHKIADYFNVSVDFLLGKEQKEKPAEMADISREQIKFAVFGDPDIDDELMDDVMSYARYKMEQKKKGK